MASINHGTVTTEGCPINYWSTGTGPLLIFIPGGNGHGRQYDPIFPHLATHYTVATYDRRQMSSSLPAVPPDKYAPLNPAQQARDALAVMRALGFSKTAIFGSSLGGIIALQIALSYPESLTLVLAHEAPLLCLLPDSTKWLDWVFHVLETYRNSGPVAAMDAFKTIMVGMDDGLQTQKPESWNVENQWANEFQVASTYCPDLRQVVGNNVPVVVGYGIESLDAAYARSTVVQAEVLNCERVLFPGHHQGFETEPVEFAEVLLSTFEELKKKNLSFE